MASEPYLTPSTIQNREDHIFSHQMKCHNVQLPEYSIAIGTADNPYTPYTR